MSTTPYHNRRMRYYDPGTVDKPAVRNKNSGESSRRMRDASKRDRESHRPSTPHWSGAFPVDAAQTKRERRAAKRLRDAQRGGAIIERPAILLVHDDA